MKIKNLISIVFLLAVTIQLANAQEKSKNDVTPDEINKATLKLIEYYESYDDGSSESQRRAKHDNAIEDHTMTEVPNRSDEPNMTMQLKNLRVEQQHRKTKMMLTKSSTHI